MPKGHVTWCDPKDGHGVVEHAGRRYAVAAGQLPRDARSAGAPVHFDISHHDAGDVAVNVTSRAGARTGHRAGRHGDLTGARSPASKQHPGTGDAGALHEHHVHETQPRELVTDWVWLLTTGRADAAAALYAPDAVLHTDEGVVAGHRAIRRHLAASPLVDATADVRGLQSDRFRVVWHTDDPARRMTMSTLRVDHGRIVEHTEAVVPDDEAGTGPSDPTHRPAVQTAVVHGHVPAHAIAYTEDKVREVVAYAPSPVRYARLALAHEQNPALARPAVVRATLDVDGRPVRAHADAPTFTEAADLLKDRLRRGLDSLGERRRTRRRDTGDHGEGEWRHGDLAAQRPAHHPRPREERDIVRRTTHARRAMTAEEASVELETLALDWLLFTELHTGADAVIERVEDGYRLRVAGVVPPTTTASSPVKIELGGGVPVLDRETAIDELDVGGLPFVFFLDDAEQHGAVVHRRYDGHYGLVVPARAIRATTT